MKLTKHAKIRMSQRGIKNIIIDLIYRYGRKERTQGDCYSYYIPPKNKHQIISELKHMIHYFEKSSGKRIIVNDDNVITTYHRK